MNAIKHITISALSLTCGVWSVAAQGTFQNLDFESPALPLTILDPQRHVEIGQALPHWIGYLGTDQQSQVLYNNLSLGTATLALLGPEHAFGTVLQGEYGVALQPGLHPSGTSRVGATIAQLGTLPTGVQSLRFLAAISHPTGSILVSFGGQELSVFALGAGAYGVNIGGFGGVTGELRFTAPVLLGGPNDIYLDAIVFSPQAIPEPATLALGTLGALVLSWRVRKRSV